MWQMWRNSVTADGGIVMCVAGSAERSQGRGRRVVMKSSCLGLLSVSSVNSHH